MRIMRAVFSFVVLGAMLGTLGRAVSTTSPRFYSDDPIARELASQDASVAARADMPDLYEMVINLFDHPGYKPSGLRAKDHTTPVWAGSVRSSVWQIRSR